MKVSSRKKGVVRSVILATLVLFLMVGAASASTNVRILSPTQDEPAIVMPGEEVAINFNFTAIVDTVLNGTIADDTPLVSGNPWADVKFCDDDDGAWEEENDAIILDVDGSGTYSEEDEVLAGNPPELDTPLVSDSPWADVKFYDDGDVTWDANNDAIILDVDNDGIYDDNVAEFEVIIWGTIYTNSAPLFEPEVTNGTEISAEVPLTVPFPTLANYNWTESCDVVVVDLDELMPATQSDAVIVGGVSEIKIGALTFDATTPSRTMTASENVPIYVNITSPRQPNWVRVNLTNFGAGVVELSLKDKNETEGWYNYTATVDLTRATYDEYKTLQVEFNVTLSDGSKETYVVSVSLRVTPDAPVKWIFVEAETNQPPSPGLDSYDNEIWDGFSDYIEAEVYVAAADRFGNVNNSLSDEYTGYVSIVSGPGILDKTSVIVYSLSWYDLNFVTVRPEDATAFVTIEVYGGGLAKATKTIGFYDRIDHLALTVEKPVLYANGSDSTRVYVALKDSEGNTIPVSNINIVIDELTTLELSFDQSENTTDGSGITAFTVTAGTLSGEATIRAIVSSEIAWDGRFGDANITLKQAPDPSQTIVIPSQITAGRECKIEFTLVDYDRKPIRSSSEFPVEFNITDGDAVWLDNNAKVYVVPSTDANGNVSARLYSTNATSNTITVVIRVKNETGQWITVERTISVIPAEVRDIRVSPGLVIGLPSVLGASQVIAVELVDAYGNQNNSNAQMLVTTDNPALGNMSNNTVYYTNNLLVTITGGRGQFTYYVNSTTPGQANLTLNVTTFNIIKTIQIRTTGPEGVSISFNQTLPMVNSDLNVTAQLTTSEGLPLAYPSVDLTLVVRNPSNSIVFTGTGTTSNNGNYTWTLLGANFTQPGVYTFKVTNATYNLVATKTLTFVGNATSLRVTVNNTAPLVNDTVQINATFYDVNGYVTSEKDDEQVTFLINDVNVGSATVENGVASITYRFEEAGDYEIVAFYNETLQDSYVLTVKAPGPDISVVDFTVTPTTGVAPLDVTINVTVTNTGTTAGDYTVVLKVDDTEVANQTVVVNAGETKIVTFEYTFEEPGTYNVSVNELPSKTVKVLAPANVYVEDFSLNVTEGVAPLPVEINATVVNDGDVAGSITVYFYVDSEEVCNKTVEVEAGATEYVTCVYVFDKPGTYNVSVNELPSKTVEVLAPLKEDFMVAIRDPSEKFLWWYIDTDGNRIADEYEPYGPDDAVGIAFGDYNGDGQGDFMVAIPDPSGKFLWWYIDTDGDRIADEYEPYGPDDAVGIAFGEYQ
uniref:Invasin domain-containing protein n=1 Tax=Archaeoglobus fulgidus TaxID=2234 RepID=A0A7C3MBX9_ARCFL